MSLSQLQLLSTDPSDPCVHGGGPIVATVCHDFGLGWSAVGQTEVGERVSNNRPRDLRAAQWDDDSSTSISSTRLSDWLC